MQLTRAISRDQRGAALVVALIILLVLTLLGVSAMNTSSLEEKMAANSQEFNRAFQAADSGLIHAFRQIDTTNLAAPQNDGTPALPGMGGNNAGARYVARYVGTSTPPINSGYGMTSGLQAYYFDIQSTGYNVATGTGAATAPAGGNASTIILSGGMYQMGLSGP